MTDQKKGCGKMVVMGHGDNAVCGQPYYSDPVWLCDACRARIISRWDFEAALEAQDGEWHVTWKLDEIIAALKACGVEVQE